jgi:5'-3' exoribonuclease 2
VQDVLEDRVHLQPGGSSQQQTLPFDWTTPNPSNLECDNLYIDMNGIIHPCSHPEQGPQPKTEEEMFENVCLYVDRLVRAVRPRQLLYLAVDGVAPRAKMNQQRSRRFRAAEEAKELAALEAEILETLPDEQRQQQQVLQRQKQQNSTTTSKPWDSNVITPGTTFMRNLSDYIRFYIRHRLTYDPSWKHLRIIFSDASLPGEGEHKICAHIRLQRSQLGYDPNLVHVIHGLDADLILLALATHEAHVYISREQVLFGRKSVETTEQRQQESGHADAQQLLDLAAGSEAMSLRENKHSSPLQRVSVPILREYLFAEFEHTALNVNHIVSFAPNFERLLDDFVFLCTFVGNDFLPHLPSLSIREGGLDFLFNVYKRILPSLGDYITKSGGVVNLSSVDVILAEVGAMEDYVFAMKHESEQRNKRFQNERKTREKQQQQKNSKGAPPEVLAVAPEPRARLGKSAKILESKKEMEAVVALSKGHAAKEESRHAKKVKYMQEQDNAMAAMALKDTLLSGSGIGATSSAAEAASKQQVDASVEEEVAVEMEAQEQETPSGSGKKRAHDDISADEESEPLPTENGDDGDVASNTGIKNDVGIVGDAEEEFDDDVADDEDDISENLLPKVEEAIVKELDPEAAKLFKEKVQEKMRQKLDKHAEEVEDNVRLHEPGWKDRYYRDKCKADDVSQNGGREHMFRSYVVGLCWIMKYYHCGCPSYTWYFPFHYAPFASDLKNIERFQKDCQSFELSTPFNPVEQLMAVLPPDSSHAIPEASRWLMLDEESPIIDFYPTTVPVDPNGKAMPWLWVVLLPFIDEERLLAALSPTMAKWKKEELLCNSRGMDDGYLYAHASHPFGKKLATILEGDKTATAAKTRLTDATSYGIKGFAGSVRPPLSHEIFPFGDEVSIPPPSTAKKISDLDSIFSDKIHGNHVVVTAFSEPAKLPHKSVLLPGAQPPPPTLTAQDKIIRAPRLNRFGGTIANMGGSSNNQSHRQGYGSMNIGTYERQLAQQNGRGNQMNQAGTRSWGSMEPTQYSRQRPQPVPQLPHIANPFLAQNRGGGGPQQWQGQHGQQHQQQHGQYHNYQQQPQQWQQQPQQQGGYNQQQSHHQGGYHHQQQYPPQQQQHGGHYQHQQGGQRYPQNVGAGGPPPQQQQRYPPNGGGQPQRQGFDFRSHKASGPPQRPGQPIPPRANADVMASLKQQLASTLNKNKR